MDGSKGEKGDWLYYVMTSLPFLLGDESSIYVTSCYYYEHKKSTLTTWRTICGICE